MNDMKMKATTIIWLLSVWLSFASMQRIIIEDGEGPLDEPFIREFKGYNLVSLQNSRCNKKLGMESGDISDDQITVSGSIPETYYGKEYARLNSDRAWVTYAIPAQWIQIDLRETMYISGVQTQSKSLIPRFRHPWVRAYQVLYKAYPRQTSWDAVSEGIGGGPVVFNGNSDPNSVETSMFREPIQAQIIKILPVQWVSGTTSLRQCLALRLELLGCSINAKSGCGSPRILTNPTGSLSSMNYPNKYDNNANCRWDIVAPQGQTVVMEFEKGFALEPSLNNCWLEFVEVLDVTRNVERSLGKFCGNTQPGKFFSTQHILRVRFMTDHYEGESGFQANYEFVNGSGCGGPQILNEESGTLQSMNFPENYENNAHCTWDILIDQTKLIEIHFLDLRLENGSEFSKGNHSFTEDSCSNDSIQIFDIGKGEFKGKRLLAEIYCGKTIPSNFRSSSNQLRITFQSNDRITDTGFRVIYKAVVASGCGKQRDLLSPSGTISSLNYPEPYINGLTCEWNIISGPNKDIKITFLNLELEEHYNCAYDYVSIYDGSNEHLLGKYCNGGDIQPLIAHSGVMKIIFVSDDFNQKKGFKASYTTMLCTKPTIKQFEVRSTSPITTAQDTTMKKAATPKFTLKTLTKVKVQFSGKTLKSTSNAVQESRTTVKSQFNIGDDSNNMDLGNTVVTEEMAKWIIIGLASVSGLLILLVLLGIIYCCRQQFSSNNISLHGSFKNGSNSGVVHNRAYDFSIGSNNQSIRSRQAEPVESSQVSESFSHQGNSGNTPCRDSHIYFSIEERCTEKKKNAQFGTTSTNKNNDSIGTKVYFKKGQQGNNTGIQSDEEEDEDVYEIEDVESNIFNGDSDNNESFIPTARSSRCNTIEKSFTKTLAKPEVTSGGAPKMMVNNILYESTDSVE